MMVLRVGVITAAIVFASIATLCAAAIPQEEIPLWQDLGFFDRSFGKYSGYTELDFPKTANEQWLITRWVGLRCGDGALGNLNMQAVRTNEKLDDVAGMQLRAMKKAEADHQETLAELARVKLVAKQCRDTANMAAIKGWLLDEIRHLINPACLLVLTMLYVYCHQTHSITRGQFVFAFIAKSIQPAISPILMSCLGWSIRANSFFSAIGEFAVVGMELATTLFLATSMTCGARAALHVSLVWLQCYLPGATTASTLGNTVAFTGMAARIGGKFMSGPDAHVDTDTANCTADSSNVDASSFVVSKPKRMPLASAPMAMPAQTAPHPGAPRNPRVYNL